MADRDRLSLIDLGEDGHAAIISVEDMIADRVGQYASGTAPEMLGAGPPPLRPSCRRRSRYMERRIRHESGGQYGVEHLEG